MTSLVKLCRHVDITLLQGGGDTLAGKWKKGK